MRRLNRRLIQSGIAVGAVAASMFASQAVIAAVSDQSAAAPYTTTAISPQAAKILASLPAQIGIAGPGGVHEGTVPRSDLFGPPPASQPGSPADPTANADMVVDGHPGYAVHDNGVLTGYFFTPGGFMTVAQVQAAGGTPPSSATGG
jgi:hypothetical protein